ncbi:MAG: putative toxin-antitoxin system toxin component, PIN family [Deltaproteobacteria bacterium]|nr:MAG: putative toxin-antitoxin system toxin component, PIN family [Deltaproteobacteria bacterium]RPJ16680.1 MAG: putative toxin-antitoxin system toxin component, PIN family [Deltaproteobacteria bacterium]
MKIVLDTNVFVSGVFFSGPPHHVLQAWRDGKVQLVISPEILDEYSRVGEALSESFPAIDLRPILELVTVNADMVSPAESAGPICDDPDDDKFFLCALSARCKLIVSGDRHLLVKSGYGGVQVLKPRDFVEKILR